MGRDRLRDSLISNGRQGASNVVRFDKSQQVICLRTIELARNGKRAHKEARLTVAEKLAAASRRVGFS